MNTRQFLAVVILFIALVVFILLTYNKRKEREKFTPLLDEAIRVNISNIKAGGAPQEAAAKARALQQGRTMEQQAAADVLYTIEKNGNVDPRSGAKVPGWLIKEYKKRYEIQ